jgi:LmbE family N-acetylglucosaminyl deacetylase
MIDLLLSADPHRKLKVLCLGAHSDDIEIGCGGTILRLLAANKDVEVDWVVLGSSGRRDDEARTSAARFLAGASRQAVVLKDFRDGFFPYLGYEIKEYFESLKLACAPDLIFTHYRHDLHQDHRLVSELTWNTFRDHLILEYEVFKYDGDLGNPNFYVPLGREVVQAKVDALMSCFPSQATHRWFTADAFTALLRLRGAECNALDSHAEAFYCRRLRVGTALE